MELKTGDIVRESWELFKSDWAFYVVGYTIVWGLGSLSNQILLGPLSVGFYACIMKRLTNQKSDYQDIFTVGFEKFVPALLVMLVVGLLTMAGVFVFLIGALFVTIYCYFSMMIVADEDNPKVMDCIHQSGALIKNHLGLIIGVFFAAVCINLLGCLPCFLGMVVTIPLANIMQVVLYAHLKTGQTDPIFVAPPKEK